jgi:hypothetical protein
MFKIEKNVPAPELFSRGRPRIYPFREMEIGDSFFVAQEKSNQFSIKLSNAAASSGFRTGAKFSIRWVEEEGGYRCWRIS